MERGSRMSNCTSKRSASRRFFPLYIIFYPVKHVVFMVILVAVLVLSKAAFIPARIEEHGLPAVYTVSQAQWAMLNRTVGGKLARGAPMAMPCYTVYNGTVVTPNVSQCSVIQQNYAEDLFIADHYGGWVTANWASCQSLGQGCALDRSLPTDPSVYVAPNQCYQGSVAPYYIAVKSVSDIQAALAFANSTGVPLTIKNSGHDYKGRSAAPNSLALWTHTLMAPPKLIKNFIPDGCTKSVGAGITFGAGQNFNNMYMFAEAHNVTVVGGSSRTVGIGGGWITGGGHSSLSNTLGLGVDNVLQIRGVLPNGTYVTANECQNSDLWFAWRGGGGSIFGVNVEMTTRAHPQVTLQVIFVRLASLSLSGQQEFIRICINNVLQWSKDGWGGYIEPGALSQLVSGLVLVTPKLTLAQAQVSIKPMTDFAASNGIALNNSIETVNSFYQMFEEYLLPNQEMVDIGLAIGSRLIPAAQFNSSSNRQALLVAKTNMSNIVSFPAEILEPHYLTYGAPLQILASNDTSSVTPAWQSAIWHVIAGQAFSNQASAATIANALRTASSAADQLRNLPLTTGAYQNEADTFEPDPVGTFWGQEHYTRLSAIKAAVDPGDILTCHQCVGWNHADPRYSCYPQL